MTIFGLTSYVFVDSSNCWIPYVFIPSNRCIRAVNIKYQSIIWKVNSASKGDWIKKDQDTYLSLGSPGYISFLPAKGSSNRRIFGQRKSILIKKYSNGGILQHGKIQIQFFSENMYTSVFFFSFFKQRFGQFKWGK